MPWPSSDSRLYATPCPGRHLTLVYMPRHALAVVYMPCPGHRHHTMSWPSSHSRLRQNGHGKFVGGWICDFCFILATSLPCTNTSVLPVRVNATLRKDSLQARCQVTPDPSPTGAACLPRMPELPELPELPASTSLGIELRAPRAYRSSDTVLSESRVYRGTL